MMGVDSAASALLFSPTTTINDWLFTQSSIARSANICNGGGTRKKTYTTRTDTGKFVLLL
jgi:hypothetical protein